MRILDLARNPLRICSTAIILSGCGAPSAMLNAQTAPLYAPPRGVSALTAAEATKNGIYVSGYFGSSSVVYGYRQNNRGNDSPDSSETSVPAAVDVAVDAKGDVMVPQGNEITIFKGPRMCGKQLAQLGIGLEGYAVDAASADATGGTIAVASVQDGSGYGSVQVCMLKTGCRKYLTNSDMNFVFGVAMANDGDCWAASQQGLSMGYAAVLTYFKGCSGSGETASGYQNASSGGLDIDKSGNLVSISCSAAGCSMPGVYVYSGCKPQCKEIGGPFSLQGTSRYGHLNESSTRLAMADYQFGQVDVYAYSPTAITYLYSFNNGLNSNIVGASYTPRSDEPRRSTRR
jgi:hypothetical protein